MNERQPATKPAGWSITRAFGWALRGVGMMVRTQMNSRIHLVATVVVVIAGFLCKITADEWMAVVVVIGMVWTAEGLNTAIEAVVDLVSPEYHPLAGRAKDVAAGAVLCAAITAVIIGLIVFGPRLLALVGR